MTSGESVMDVLTFILLIYYRVPARQLGVPKAPKAHGHDDVVG